MKTEIFDANLEDVYRSVCDLEYYPSWSGNGIKSIKKSIKKGKISEERLARSVKKY